MLKIIVIEDNEGLRSLIALDLRSHGYEVYEADCAESFDEISAKHQVDLLILDLNLPGEDGISIARRTKGVNPNLFIIMLTARGAEVERILGYEQGADLYLVKPVSEDELLAAVKVVQRRIQNRKIEKNQLILDAKNLTLQGSQKIHLSKEDTSLLKSLAQAELSRLPYFRLLEILDKDVDERTKATLEVKITRLRKKIIQAGVR